MIPINTFSCSRPLEFKISLDTYKNLSGIDPKTSTLHEDYFEGGIQDVCNGADFKFGNYIECRPALGMGHAIYEVYKKKESKWVLHMEDDWTFNHHIDVDTIIEHANRLGLNQIFLSSKVILQQEQATTTTQANRDPDVLIGTTGLFERKDYREKFGHIIPNTTPSLIKTDLFHGFIDVVDEYLNTGASESNKMFVKDFKADKPFLFINSPSRFWKVWMKSLMKKPPILGFLIGRDKTTISHQRIGTRRRISKLKVIP
jgi:hypothetical protein